MPSTGQTLFTLVGIFTSIGGLLADFNETHIYNPTWTPHAKFHTGQTMSMGVYLGGATIYFALRKAKDPLDNLNITTIFAMAYWVTQALAIFYPGTKAADPPQDPDTNLQLYLQIGVTVFVSLAYYLERGRLGGVKRE